MTREQAKIAGAWAAGETVQFRAFMTTEWVDYPQNNEMLPIYDVNTHWRIKPKAREWHYCSGCCRMYVIKPPNGCERCTTPLVHVREVLE